uniref:Transmembrane protein 198 n=1 Tax=Globisporangium ultimum (strain ATCC 200006 / CBS 805.95 / DAOM BR144) TaxID=431595 RepID=K3WBV8_GLOUD
MRSTSPMTTLLLVALCGVMQVALVAAQSWTNVTDDIKDTITDQGNAIVDGSASDKLKLGPSASAVLSICAGVAVCFCGYRLLRPTMFVSGFLVGGFLASSAIEYLFKHESWVDTAWWISLFVGGLLAGALVVALYSIGIFAIGAAGGVLLATMLNTSVGYKLFPENPNTGLLILAIVLGLIGGILALKIERPVIVIATSLVGAVLAVSGIGYFAKNLPDITDLKQFATKNEEGEWVYAMPTVWWGYLGGMLALFLLGMFVQFKKTASVNHTRSNSAAKFEAKAAGYSHA